MRGRAPVFPPFAALAAALTAAAPAHAQDAAPFDLVPPPPPAELLLDDDALNAVLNGADLEGCYPDGSIFAERTAPDGVLYDLLRPGPARVGSWWVEDGEVCYLYSDPAVSPGPHCWHVMRRNGDLDFFIAGTGLLGGTTDCGEPMV